MSLRRSTGTPPLVAKKAHCRVCNRGESIFLCNHCNVVPYCSREHMMGDKAAHRRFCRKINQARVLVNECDAGLQGRARYDWNEDSDSPWQWPSFDKYMKARRLEVQTLMAVDTFEAYEKAWLQARDMILLARRDQLEIYFHLPYLLLRMGKEQELYDYLTWFETYVPDQHFRDFENTNDEHKDADFFGPVDIFCRPYSDLNTAFTVMPLKGKILLDLQKMLDGHEVSQIVTKRLDDPSVVHYPSQHCWLIHHTDEQIRQLFRAIKQTWPWMWPAFLRPHRHLKVNYFGWIEGTELEVCFAPQRTHKLWKLMPEVIEMFRNLALQDRQTPL
ncbi:hypothetical protein IWZ01DRAFT_494122 [Phyllosticta capitalensis]